MTHGLSWLPEADQIVVLKDGRVAEVGTYHELLHEGTHLVHLIKTSRLQLDQQKQKDLDQEQTTFEENNSSGLNKNGMGMSLVNHWIISVALKQSMW